MDVDQALEQPLETEEDFAPVLPHRRLREDSEMDITPMIDMTFLLLIFFLVCSTSTMQDAVDLPRARHGTGVSDRTSVIVTVAERGGPGPARVYLGDGIGGTPLPDTEDSQSAAITEAVQRGVQEGKTTVLIKAAGSVKTGDVWRVESAAGQVEGVKLHVAVLEAED